MRFLKIFFLGLGIVIERRPPVKEILRTLSLMRPLNPGIELVRVGGELDGGYLIPNDLLGIDAVFSPGVDRTATFELFFANQGVDCFLIDGSVDDAPIKHRRIHFEKLWLSSKTFESSDISLTDWVLANAKESDDLLLQMDIEGAEYECLLSTDSEILNKFRIIVLELHDVQSILNRAGSRLTRQLFEHMARTHYLVHTHVNNHGAPILIQGMKIPQTVEFSFINKKRITQPNSFSSLPHVLDRANTKNKDWTINWDGIR